MNRKQEPLPGSGQLSFTNIWQNATVSGRVTIVKGTVQGGGNGSIVTWYYNDTFPSQRFPLVNGEFKAIVRLESGQNKILFEAERDNGGPARQELVLNFQPVLENPPLNFALLVAKDSPLTFDSQDYKREKEGNGLDQAIAKLRMASYLMSAFTQEQMSRNRFGFRTFQPHEEFEKCTLSARDAEKLRPTAHIHIVRVDKTVAEIQDPDVAQQNSDAKRSGDLFGWAADAVKAHPSFKHDHFQQAACIYLDAHYDSGRNLITGHAALGGCVGNLRLAIFGGHAIHTWPKSFEDLVPYFMDTTPTDTRQVANDAPDDSFTYEALNVSMGAFMHEVGHLLGCPHEPSGVMLRGYLNWNRSFLVTEPANPRTNNNTPNKCFSIQDEDYWHRLDIMRFRWHQSFRLPGEVRYKSTSRPQFYPLHNGVEIHSTNGVSMVEIQVDDWSKGHIEFANCPPIASLTLDEVKSKLSGDDRNKNIKIIAHAPCLESTEINEFNKFCAENASGKSVASATNGRESGDYRYVELPKTPLKKVIIWAGLGFDGVEFIDVNGNSTVFGNKGGSPHEVEIGSNNEFSGLSVRSGYWVDAAGVITKKFSTPQYGGPGGGIAELVAPQGRRITAISGWYENWCQGVRIHYDL